MSVYTLRAAKAQESDSLGVFCVALAGSRLFLEFTAEASELFAVAREVELKVDVPGLSFRDLVTGLERVLGFEGVPV
ncbi:hypothetical protein H4696_003117 [Amycolatopsis lexingtonensis]|uniref:Uncharacterized protein n=1 Tax=Amycolatopsis lexingtonensis TaxID=218822 RepID=A0ABR9HYL0_9PSEU|nr:hypothetical protein [Amycolatopsis lexingtonensis]MBE1496017.1 hypothetical protein [Amycolatopsis lexingtonensis]